MAVLYELMLAQRTAGCLPEDVPLGTGLAVAESVAGDNEVQPQALDDRVEHGDGVDVAASPDPRLIERGGLAGPVPRDEYLTVDGYFQHTGAGNGGTPHSHRVPRAFDADNAFLDRQPGILTGQLEQHITQLQSFRIAGQQLVAERVYPTVRQPNDVAVDLAGGRIVVAGTADSVLQLIDPAR